jgi:membrane-bound inhibitor of C-type lysozyme
MGVYRVVGWNCTRVASVEQGAQTGGFLMRLDLLALMSAAALLAACNNTAPADSAAATSEVAAAPTATAPVAYRCDDGTTFSVSYDLSSPTAGSATVVLSGNTYRLAQIEAASGAKYYSDTGPVANKGLALWNKGTEVSLYEVTPTTDSNPIEMLMGICQPET